MSQFSHEYQRSFGGGLFFSSEVLARLSLMYRRKGASDDDDGRLLEDEDISNGDNNGGIDCPSPPRIKEEAHIIRRPFSVLKRRLSAKASSPKRKLVCWWVTVSLLGVVAFIFVLVPLLVERGKKKGCSDFVGGQYDSSMEEVELPFFFKSDTGHFEICQQGKSILSGTLGVNRSGLSEVKVNVFTDSMNSILNITNLPSKKDRCILIQWIGTSSNETPLQDCYEFGSDVYWYGAYEQSVQQWPLDPSTADPLKFAPFLPNDYLYDIQSSSSLGSVLHPLWLSTAGVGIIVEDGVHFRISMNSTQLCLSAKPFQLECTSNASVRTFLNYTVCAFDTVAQAAQYFLGESAFIPRPSSIPEPSLFIDPLWSTSAKLNSGISTDEVVQLCEDIVMHGFSVSQFEIGDGYSLSYGDLHFNSKLDFDTIDTSLCASFDLTTWVHPFVNFDSNRFMHGLENDFFLPGYTEVNGQSVSLVQWWKGYGGVTNILDGSARSNFEQELLDFQDKYNLSSFTFDAGEYNYLPKCVYIEGLDHPGDFTKAYVDFISRQKYSSRAIVRVGYFTQDKPILVRLSGSSLTSDLNAILKYILNAVLSIGLAGYPFVVPDMVGSHTVCTSPDNRTCLDLYLRWAQLNTFLPVMHFSIPPWNFNDSNLTKHIKWLTQIHASLNFTQFAYDSISTGYPIIRPSWWRADFLDSATWNISDQFFIGDSYMVAPILEIGRRNRTVYFPRGAKYCLTPDLSSDSPCPSTRIYDGGTRTSFNATIYEILWFKIVDA